MKKELKYFFLFIGICLVIYLLFRNLNCNNQYTLIEGMTDASGNKSFFDDASGNKSFFGDDSENNAMFGDASGNKSFFGDDSENNAMFGDDFSYADAIPLGKNTSLVSNGIASNAASYAAAIKASTIKLQDTFLIGKYRSDYETAIINLDDFINNLMLQNALSFDKENPETSSTKLFELQQAKVALNDVMKYLDTQ